MLGQFGIANKLRIAGRGCCFFYTRSRFPSLVRYYAIPVKGKIRTNKRPVKPAKLGKLTDDNDFEFFNKLVNDKGKKGKVAEKVAVKTAGSKSSSTAWVTKFLSKSDVPPAKRIEDVGNFFAEFTSYDKVQTLSTDFVSCLRPKLLQFGDLILKDVVKEDEQLKNVYDESNPNYSYLLASIQILRGFDHFEVIRSRMDTKRKTVSDESIYEEFKNCLKSDTDKSGIYSLIQAYLQLPKPRAIHMEAEDMEEFLENIGGHLDEIELKIVGAIYQDVMESGMMLTPNELKKWISSTLQQFHEFDEGIYKELSLGIQKLGYKVTRDHYNMFLAACLNSENYPLFEQILKDMSKEELEPNRYTLTLMNNYSGLTYDIGRWLNVMELRMNQYPFLLTADDYQAMFSSLIGIDKALSEKILGTLMTIRAGFRDMHEKELVKENMMDILEIDNSTKEFVPYEDPLELFDLVSDTEEIIMIYPRLTSGMFEPFIEGSTSIEEMDKWCNMMDQNAIVKDLETFHSIFGFLFENRRIVKFDKFKEIVLGMINDSHDEYLRFLIEDEHNLRVFVSMSELYVEAGELNGNDNKVVDGIKMLWGYLEDINGEVDEELYLEVVKSIIAIVGTSR